MGVFTELSDEDRTSIVEDYGLKSLSSVIGIANGDTETTYLFRTGEGELIVTLFEDGVEPLDLEQAFETMDNLYANGVPCPKPIRTLDGRATTYVAERLVAVVSFLAGSPTMDISVERARSLGRVMGQIHSTLARKSQRKTVLLPTGSVHGALVHDNVFFLGDAVSGVINFRLRHDSVFVSEIAEVLVGWTLNARGQIDINRAHAILNGYQSVRSLTGPEKDVLPGFVLASAATHYAGNGHFEQLPELALIAYKSMTAEMTNLIGPFKS